MKVQELLDNESKWIKGKYAVNSLGRDTSLHLPDACKWCFVGAIHKCFQPSDIFPSVFLYIKVIRDKMVALGIGNIGQDESPYMDLIAWNDHPDTSYQDVIGVAGALKL